MLGFTKGVALVVGISNYPRAPKLPPIVAKDARDLAALLCSPDHCGYSPDRVALRLEQEARGDAIRAELGRLAAAARPHDTAVVFFSGHGGRVLHGPDAGSYLIPYDCDPDRLRDSAIGGDELTMLLREIRSERLLVIFDACYSGGTGEPKAPAAGRFELAPGLGDADLQQLAQGKGRAIIASSRADEVSFAHADLPNSVFTHFLLEGLRGGCISRGDGLIRVLDLFAYLSEKIPALENQHPIFKGDIENNFPVALYRPQRADPMALLADLDRRFNRAEIGEVLGELQQDLRIAGLDAHLSLEEVAGEGGKRAQFLEMIQYLERRGWLGRFVRIAEQHRPR